MRIAFDSGIRIGPFSTSRRELVDLLKAWIALSVVFAILLSDRNFGARFAGALGIAAIAVGVGFLFHELAHKIVAQRYGCFAEFRSFDHMLLLALFFSFLGFVFAAPGAVMINGQVTRRENGLISLAGPLMNIAAALVFFALSGVMPVFRVMWDYGFQINSWLAVFNLIPFWVLDGRKVWEWDKLVWVGAMGVAVLLGFFF